MPRNKSSSSGDAARSTDQDRSSGRPHRASGEMAYHVVDIVNGIIDASNEGRSIELTSTCPQPAPLPAGLDDWTIDD